jgi:hypothetical protein
LKVLQAIGAHKAEVDVTFGAVAEASPDSFAASITRPQNDVFYAQCHLSIPLFQQFLHGSGFQGFGEAEEPGSAA